MLQYIIDLTTNDVVITDATAFVQTNKEKLAAAAFAKEDNNEKDSKEPGFNEDQLQEKQEEELEREMRLINNMTF